MKLQKVAVTTVLSTLLVFGGVTSANAQNPWIGMDRGAEIAQERMNGAIPLEVEFDTVNGQQAYEIGFADGTEVYVARRTGDILRIGQDSPSSDARATERLAAQTPDRVSFLTAALTAKEAGGGARMMEVELEREDGQLMYEVDLAGDIYVYIWAVSGEVYEVEHDNWD